VNTRELQHWPCLQNARCGPLETKPQCLRPHMDFVLALSSSVQVPDQLQASARKLRSSRRHSLGCHVRRACSDQAASNSIRAMVGEARRNEDSSREQERPGAQNRRGASAACPKERNHQGAECHTGRPKSPMRPDLNPTPTSPGLNAAMATRTSLSGRLCSKGT